MYCWKVTLETTNAMKDTARLSNSQGYITVEDGVIYVIADSLHNAVEMLPTALGIERVGRGLSCKAIRSSK